MFINLINTWINIKYITKITAFILFCLIIWFCSLHDFTDFNFLNSHNFFETISAERILQLCVAVFFFKTIWLVQKFLKIWNSCNNGVNKKDLFLTSYIHTGIMILLESVSSYRRSSHFVIFGSKGYSWNVGIMNSEDWF